MTARPGIADDVNRLRSLGWSDQAIAAELMVRFQVIAAVPLPHHPSPSADEIPADAEPAPVRRAGPSNFAEGLANDAPALPIAGDPLTLAGGGEPAPGPLSPAARSLLALVAGIDGWVTVPDSLLNARLELVEAKMAEAWEEGSPVIRATAAGLVLAGACR
ncbi:MAG: hypothetical protein EPN20_12415 [Magnetospirillum sp.]|nr:MAG: hypothetical protein EPN20_12415 [Magnetospirillum sp.]